MQRVALRLCENGNADFENSKKNGMMPSMSKKEEAKTLTTEEKLDLIVGYLRQMNKRDKLRMVGGFFRGIIGIIPAIIVIVSMYYFYTNSDALLEKISRSAAEQAARVTSQNANKIIDVLDTKSLLEQFRGE